MVYDDDPRARVYFPIWSWDRPFTPVPVVYPATRERVEALAAAYPVWDASRIEAELRRTGYIVPTQVIQTVLGPPGPRER